VLSADWCLRRKRQERLVRDAVSFIPVASSVVPVADMNFLENLPSKD
jgi:hypothetical protein